MDQETTNPETEVEQPSIADRLERYLESQDQPEPEDEPQPETEPEQSEPEAETEEPAEAEEEPKYRIKHNGEEKEYHVSELLELAQKGFDYTQKTQTAAEKAKALELREQAIGLHEQLAQATLQQQAQLMALDAQMKPYEGIDWQAWADQDPAAAQKGWIAFQQLQQHRDATERDLHTKSMQQMQERAHFYQSRVNEMVKETTAVLAKEIGWNQEMDKQMQQFLLSAGYAQEELSPLIVDRNGIPQGINHSVLDPRALKIVADAMKYRAMKQSKAAVENKVRTAPKIVKAGPAQEGSREQQTVRNIRAQVQKSGGKANDVAAYLMATGKV